MPPWTADPILVNARPGIPAYESYELGAKRNSIALLIPVLNEGERIRSQLTRIAEYGPAVDVYLADGGSTDGALEPGWLKERDVQGLLIKQGPGKLSAQLRMGFAHLLELGYESIITMDGNGKDGVDGIEAISKSLRGGTGYVQGSRFVPGGEAINTPKSRTAAIRLLHAPLTSLAARSRFTDTTNGFRGHSRALLIDPRVAIFRDVFDSYELLAYLPIQAAKLGYSTAEAPVSRAYPDDGHVPTKIHGFSGNKQVMKILLKAVRGDYKPSSVEAITAAQRNDIPK